MVKVRQVMRGDPVLISLDAPATEAARLMRDHDIREIVVVCDGEVRGLITERDILIRGVAEFLDHRDFSALTVRDICTRDPIALDPDDDLGRAARLMRAHGVRTLPVADESGRAVGILALDEVAREDMTAVTAGPAAVIRPSR